MCAETGTAGAPTQEDAAGLPTIDEGPLPTANEPGDSASFPEPTTAAAGSVGAPLDTATDSLPAGGMRGDAVASSGVTGVDAPVYDPGAAGSSAMGAAGAWFCACWS